MILGSGKIKIAISSARNGSLTRSVLVLVLKHNGSRDRFEEWSALGDAR